MRLEKFSVFPSYFQINCERGWLLLASCLSAFQPRDENLFAYLLSNFSEIKESDEQGEKSYKSICQLKCIQMAEEGKRGRTRLLPPFGPVEMRTIDRRTHGQVFLEIEGVYERVESWMQIGEVAGRVGSKRFGKFGKNFSTSYEGVPYWTLDFAVSSEEERYELDSNAFIFDTNFEVVDYSQFGKVFGSDMNSNTMPSSPTLLFAKMMYAQPQQSQMTAPMMHKVKPIEHLNKISPLSSKSRLNERYFKAESAMPMQSPNSRTKSLDNLLDDLHRQFCASLRLVEPRVRGRGRGEQIVDSQLAFRGGRPGCREKGDSGHLGLLASHFRDAVG